MADACRYAQALDLIDQVNSNDPAPEDDRGQVSPRALLYGRRMSDMLDRYRPDASEVVRLAVRAQHVRRWEVPRSQFPMTRAGYHQWRTYLYGFHADAAAELLQHAGYDEETIQRVRAAIDKRNLRTNPDTQTVEDVAALVFVEHYLADFSEQKPEYDEQKWIGILAKTWVKMSAAAKQFALGGALQLPTDFLPLIERAIAESAASGAS